MVVPGCIYMIVIKNRKKSLSSLIENIDKNESILIQLHSMCVFSV